MTERDFDLPPEDDRFIGGALWVGILALAVPHLTGLVATIATGELVYLALGSACGLAGFFASFVTLKRRLGVPTVAMLRPSHLPRYLQERRSRSPD